MIFSAEPSSFNAYQTRTNEKKPTMQNVSFKSFRCKKCNQPKSVLGRKSLGWKAGFACKDCAQ